ncbi:tetratricopeptide repeat protein 23 isoform X2 [Rhincodon typus]|uniref:tetratricopeptide repeat protein 23 isoform X2 n=1 Tax=Rhincodon typus TaxID=259920 RepID=UPI00202EFE44|nr:tetratricopeptide repeat protein 23 isoform X2 [Rhincodon typus]
MNSALLDPGPEEDLDSEGSSRTFSGGEETQLCDTGRSSEEARTPSTPNERARFRRRHRNDMKEAAIMIPPEEKLVQSEQRARIYAASQEDAPAMQELIRCVALARISFGDLHWKVARAHVNLAEGYLQIKGQALQAKLHCEKAKEIMYSNTRHPVSEEERKDILRCLITMFLTLGKVMVGLQNLKEAEQNLLKSEKVADELRQAEEVPLEEIRQVNAEITLTLGRLYMKENKTAEAVACYEKVLQMVKLDKGESSMECVSIYRDLAAAERARGAHDISTQLLTEAHSIVLTNAASGKEEGQITLALAEAYASTGRTEDHHLAEKYYKHSLQCYQTALGAEHATSLSVLDDYSRFLILAKNYSAASRLLHESLPAKLSTFGDFSVEVEETYHLFGGIELAEGHQKAAYKMFKKVSGGGCSKREDWSRSFKTETCILCCGTKTQHMRRDQSKYLFVTDVHGMLPRDARTKLSILAYT